MTKPTPTNDNAPKKRYIVTYAWDDCCYVCNTREEANNKIKNLVRDHDVQEINIYEVGEPMHPVISF